MFCAILGKKIEPNNETNYRLLLIKSGFKPTSWLNYCRKYADIQIALFFNRFFRSGLKAIIILIQAA